MSSVAVLRAVLVDLRAREHARDFGHAFLFAEARDGARGDAAVVVLLDHEVRVGEGGDGRQVRDAEHLMMARDVGDGAADLFSATAPPTPASTSSNT